MLRSDSKQGIITAFKGIPFVDDVLFETLVYLRSSCLERAHGVCCNVQSSVLGVGKDDCDNVTP